MLQRGSFDYHEPMAKHLTTIFVLLVLVIGLPFALPQSQGFDAWCKAHHYDGACQQCSDGHQKNPDIACIRKTPGPSETVRIEIVGKDAVIEEERKGQQMNDIRIATLSGAKRALKE